MHKSSFVMGRMFSFGTRIRLGNTLQRQDTLYSVLKVCIVLRFGGGSIFGRSIVHQNAGSSCGVFLRTRHHVGIIFKKGAFKDQVGVPCVKMQKNRWYISFFIAHTLEKYGENAPRSLASFADGRG